MSCTKDFSCDSAGDGTSSQTAFHVGVIIPENECNSHIGSCKYCAQDTLFTGTVVITESCCSVVSDEEQYKNFDTACSETNAPSVSVIPSPLEPSLSPSLSIKPSISTMPSPRFKPSALPSFLSSNSPSKLTIDCTKATHYYPDASMYTPKSERGILSPLTNHACTYPGQNFTVGENVYRYGPSCCQYDSDRKECGLWENYSDHEGYFIYPCAFGPAESNNPSATNAPSISIMPSMSPCKTFAYNGADYSTIDGSGQSLLEYCLLNSCCTINGYYVDMQMLACRHWSTNPQVMYEMCPSSCHGAYSCTAIGSTVSNVRIEENSCLGKDSCSGIGNGRETSNVQIGPFSCTKDFSCKSVGSNDVIIPEDECNSDVGSCRNCAQAIYMAVTVVITESCCSVESGEEWMQHVDTACHKNNVPSISIDTSEEPSQFPSLDFSFEPSLLPSTSPSTIESNNPSSSSRPSSVPSTSQSLEPSQVPSSSPSIVKSSVPSLLPSIISSSNPTSISSTSECENMNEAPLDIEIKLNNEVHDNVIKIMKYESSTRRFLKRIFRKGKKKFDTAYATYNWRVCLDRSECYRFVIKDLGFANGFTSGDEMAYVKLHWNGQKIKRSRFRYNLKRMRKKFGNCFGNSGNIFT
ncbi:hypothetical protein CTEN210_00807 [Chaetoceros tenuissimus]|uniref:ShKT domain-containing protein n=1 Tax=Chaetoceros tenuissimus TaxID=426638 RepID=A0AAD3CEF1_9STRA|nr:hypothetical protein CTEN210_00807 [Chaetoceros tenuissimus]